MNRWGNIVVTRARWFLALGAVLVVVMAAYGTGVFASLSNGGFEDSSSESTRAAAAEKAFGRHDADVVVIYSSKTQRATDPAFRASVQDTVRSLPASAVENVSTWYDTRQPSQLSSDRHATNVVISLAGSNDDERLDNFDAIRGYLDAEGLTTQVGGQWSVFKDVNETVSADIARAESLSMPLVLLLSLVIFGSIVAALIPVGVGVVAIVGALSVVRLITTVADVSVFAVNVITLLGLGLAIDYALFIISRFREELARQPDDGKESVANAVRATIRTAGRTVLFSGLTVAAALASLLVFPQNFLRSMGYGGIAAVIVAMVTALTLLPAGLMVLGRRVEAGRMPWRRRPRESSGRGWERFAHVVMRRPLISMVVVVGVLLALASPFLRVHWGGVDERVLPQDAASRVAADRLAADFGGETSSASVVVRDASPSQVGTYAAALRQVRDVDAVRTIDRTSDSRSTLLDVSWSGDGQTADSQRIVRDLRAVPSPDGTLVGGVTATTVDMLSGVQHQLPWMALIVVAVMLVLLFLAFGSVVLPIKAVIVNAISITASFGVVTWIFADGHLSGLLGFESTGYLDGTQPILMLAILFGLSMDYEVFLLSRIREQWDATHDNEVAVATGVQRTGRIITSAALLLAVVIGAFSTSGIVFIKMIGVGMLVAVLLDATVVRLILVPATMKLLGHLNWWAPGPMRRWWERHGLRETEAEVAPEDRERILAS